MKRLMKAGALLALTAIGTQAAAAPPRLAKCLTKAEFQAGMAYLTPTILTTVVDQCKAGLPGSSYLASKGDVLLARYAYSPAQHDAALNSLIAKVGPEMGDSKMDALTLRGVFNAMIGGEIRKLLNPKACSDVSELLGLLDPLPAENMYGIFDFILTKVDAEQKAKALRNNLPAKPMFCELGSQPTPASK